MKKFEVRFILTLGRFSIWLEFTNFGMKLKKFVANFFVLAFLNVANSIGTARTEV